MISAIFSPPFFLSFSIFIILSFSGYDISKASWWTGYTALFALTIGAFIFLGIKRKFFSDFDISKREERRVMFMFIFLLTLLYIAGLFLLRAPSILFVLTYIQLTLLVLIAVINKFVKVSGHTAFIAAFATFLSLTSGVFIVLILIPIVAWSRLVVKRHTLKEVFIGGLLGVIVTAGLYFLLI